MRALASALSLTLFVLAAPALADALPLELTWDAPSECPSGARIEGELRRITRPRPGRQLIPLIATATIARRNTLYQLTLTTEHGGARNQVQFENATCEPLLRAAILVLALAYGDGVELEDAPDSEPSRAAWPSKQGRPDASSTERPRPASTTDEPYRSGNAFANRRLEVVPWVAATATSGANAGLAGGAEVGVMVGSPHFRTSLRVAASPPAKAAQRDGVSAHVASISSALGACVELRASVARVAGCARFETGVLRASSAGARVDGSASPAWFAVAPSLLARVPIGPAFALRAELGVLVPFSSPHFEVKGEGTLYQTASVIPELALGLEIAL